MWTFSLLNWAFSSGAMRGYGDGEREFDGQPANEE